MKRKSDKVRNHANKLISDQKKQCRILVKDFALKFQEALDAEIEERIWTAWNISSIIAVTIETISPMAGVVSLKNESILTDSDGDFETLNEVADFYDYCNRYIDSYGCIKMLEDLSAFVDALTAEGFLVYVNESHQLVVGIALDEGIDDESIAPDEDE